MGHAPSLALILPFVCCTAIIDCDQVKFKFKIKSIKYSLNVNKNMCCDIKFD